MSLEYGRKSNHRYRNHWNNVRSRGNSRKKIGRGIMPFQHSDFLHIDPDIIAEGGKVEILIFLFGIKTKFQGPLRGGQVS